jgi:phage baseplate assembly protein V
MEARVNRKDLSAVISQVIRPLKHRLAALARTAEIERVDDTGNGQRVQVDGYTLDDDVERWGTYGLSVHPKAGAEALVLRLGGHGDAALVIATEDRRYRVKVEEGEVALYDDQGQVVALRRAGIEVTPKAGGTVDVGGSGATVNVDGGTVNVRGSTVRLGDVSPRSPVARSGDAVQVTVAPAAFGTIGGTQIPAVSTVVTGTITEGSARVEASA